MKFFIAAVVASLSIPTSASAETWWLLLAARNGTVSPGGLSLEKIAMSSEEECEQAGEKIFNSKDLDSPNNVHHEYVVQSIRYICIKGK